MLSDMGWQTCSATMQFAQSDSTNQNSTSQPRVPVPPVKVTLSTGGVPAIEENPNLTFTLNASVLQKMPPSVRNTRAGADLADMKFLLLNLGTRIQALELSSSQNEDSSYVDQSIPNGPATLALQARNLREIQEVIGAEPVGNNWVEVLNYVADKNVLPFGEQLALAGLNSSDSAVRAAAARALAVASPKKTKQMLPSRLAEEPNRVVQAAFRSAMRTADL